MGNRFAGIEVELRGEETVFHVAILKRNGNKLTVESVSGEISSPEKLPVKVLTDIPAAVVITGKGILNRQVQADPDSTREILLRKILPNVNADEFFISSRKNGSGHYVSLARKSAAVPVYTEIRTICSVAALDVGSHCISDIRSFLPPADVIHCGRHVVTFDTESISGIEYLQEENAAAGSAFTIGGEDIPGHSLVAFSVGLRLATGNYFSLDPDPKEEFIQRKLFRTTLRAAIVLILAILSVNFFTFSHYWSLQQELESQSGSGGSSIAEVNALREQVRVRSTFLQNAGLLNNTSFAWYADQLAHNMPDGIRLSQMNFSPRVKLAEEDSIGFQTNAIEISGNCEESIILNRWIQLLQGEPWVSSASVRSYEQGKTDATGKFTLDLQLH